MIKIYIVICDNCGKEIDAKNETFMQTDNFGDLCHDCYNHLIG